MKEKILNIARIVVLSFILSTAIGYSLADWAPPPACGAPPCGNTPPPINVGAAPQMRDGMLFVNNRLYATKAETQSTVGAVGCVPGPGCDSGTTLTTKDYVDGQVAGVVALKYLRGTGCATCPYGSFNTGGGFKCYLKTETASLVLPELNWCAGTTGSPNLDWGFWTY